MPSKYTFCFVLLVFRGICIVWRIFSALLTCSSSNECEYDCIKVSGVDTCTCAKGYELTSDGKTCAGMYDQNCYM